MLGGSTSFSSTVMAAWENAGCGGTGGRDGRKRTRKEKCKEARVTARGKKRLNQRFSSFCWMHRLQASPEGHANMIHRCTTTCGGSGRSSERSHSSCTTSDRLSCCLCCCRQPGSRGLEWRLHRPRMPSFELFFNGRRMRRDGGAAASRAVLRMAHKLDRFAADTRTDHFEESKARWWKGAKRGGVQRSRFGMRRHRFP